MPKTTLLDFVSPFKTPYADLQARLVRTGVVISRYDFNSTPNGARLGAVQFAVILHEGIPFDFHWRRPDDPLPFQARVKTGQFHLIPAHTPVHVAWTGTQRAGVVAFVPDHFRAIAEDLFGGTVPEIPPRVALDDLVVRHLVAALCGKIGRTEPHIALCADQIATVLASHLLATFGVTSKPLTPPPKGGLSMSQQRRVIAYTESHVGEDIHLVDLAAEAGLSRHHFCRAFKQTFGETPCHYANTRLMHEAKQHLLGRRQTITEIAHELGFSSSNYFSHAFRKHTGMTPEEFRRRNA
jgi:AraC family transcriptional regulator